MQRQATRGHWPWPSFETRAVGAPQDEDRARKSIPDPDLMVRSAVERRVSNHGRELRPLHRTGLAGKLVLSTAITCATWAGSAQAQEKVVQVGQVMSIAAAATFIASEMGYFQAQGIKVEISNLD